MSFLQCFVFSLFNIFYFKSVKVNQKKKSETSPSGISAGMEDKFETFYDFKNKLIFKNLLTEKSIERATFFNKGIDFILTETKQISSQMSFHYYYSHHN